MGLYGLDAYRISVEIDIASNPSEVPSFQIVGLADNAVKESRERVRAALAGRFQAWPLFLRLSEYGLDIFLE